jgi:cell division protein FtsW (lipid II flippase)
MGVSYTTARARDRRAVRLGASGLGRDGLVAAAAFVALLLIAVCYLGRLHALDAMDAAVRLPVMHLSTVTDAAELEPAMALAFEHPVDRRLAARELHAAIRGAHEGVANVGALSRIEVPVAALDRLPPGSVFTSRRIAALEAATGDDGDGDGAAPAVPLFTAADLAAVKPALIVRTRDEHRRVVFWCALAFVGAFLAVPLAWRYRGVRGDRVLLAGALLLTTLGFLVMLSRPDPLRDTVLVVRYTQGVAIGLAAFLVVSFLDVRRLAHLGFSYLPLAVGLALSLALIVFGSGPGTSGARINLGPVQPMEAIRLLLALFLAGYFARRWEVIRQLHGTTFRNRQLPGWLNLPRPDHVLPVVAAVALALVLFFALRDLGPALLLSTVFLAMFAVARARVGMAIAGLVVLVAGFYVGHQAGISSTLSSRVAMWQSPWENAVRGGDQVAQAMWTLASGGTFGTGLGLGSTRFLPAGHTDLVLAAVAEELGAGGVMAAIVVFGVIAWRGLRISRNASTDYGFFLALAVTLLIVTPALVMTAGMLGLIPLTGVVTPFVSYGGSAMVVNFVALGLLVACAAGREPESVSAPFRVPVRWLGASLAASVVILVVVWARVQVVSADEVLVRPQLGRQADGGVRFQYNPRVLEMARLIPRGTVFDRAGIPLATDDPALVQAEADVYERMRLPARELCPNPGGRCYPLGGHAFHVLGDAQTRTNWAASNSSYVERDAEDRLRGFDDRAVSVRTSGADEDRAVALRRDYTPLVPLVRHRWEPEHPDVKAVFDRPRDIRLTIDARLQYQVAGILARSVAAAGVKQGAAVIIDADTGEVLASASYPWPGARTSSVPADALLDRARYGLYPPGSTFKVITAAAALREDPSLSGLAFVCSRLPGDRVGARLPGVSRPVRDDVRDRHPHGAIAMHDGLVRSCNAYFAQLALRLGPEVLAGTSSLAGIALSPSSDPATLNANLPHAGYGQGQVLTTPLRLARVAAAIGADGVIREVPIVLEAGAPVATAFLTPDSARLLARSLRDAVTGGTGRLLASHPARIAGKTGTAEVDDAASHAWFMGFAPHGEATKRIAFAVILENAGYGGASAAAAAGQMVTAAASLGLVR